jgi:hypothetical protein
MERYLAEQREKKHGFVRKMSLSQIEMDSKRETMKHRSVLTYDCSKSDLVCGAQK